MRTFISNIFRLTLVITLIVGFIVFVAWLFDCNPDNLHFVFSLCYKSLAVSFLFHILFGEN